MLDVPDRVPGYVPDRVPDSGVKSEGRARRRPCAIRSDLVEEHPDVSLSFGEPEPLPGMARDLRHLSAEQAATLLCDEFLRWGSGQATVLDPVEVRRLVRLDCRRRGVKVTTSAVGEIVVILNEERLDAFRNSPDWDRAQDAALAALDRVRGRSPGDWP